MMEKIVSFSPAFDRRDPVPSKNYGIGGVRIHFKLRGPKGGVTWTISTPMYLPHVAEELEAKKRPSTLSSGMGYEIAYHTLTPQFEGQTKWEGDCEMTQQGFCYNDAGYIAGWDLFKRFLAEGESAVWDTLQEWYDENCK